MGAPYNKLYRSKESSFAKPRACRPQRQWFGAPPSGKPDREPVPTAIASNVREILSVASRVASMPDREAIQRYHSLIDKQLDASLTPVERFELERIEIRLDANDRDPLIEARDRELATERTRVLDSIHALLARLQS
jgi:hypothetical protein